MISITPSWVWIILVYLIFIGVKATKTRIVYLPKLFIVPVVLTALKYKVFLSGNIGILAIYLISMVAGISIGFIQTSMLRITIIKERKSIKIPGNTTRS